MPHGLLGTTHFTLQKQVALIQGHGTSVLIFPVLQCPCLLDDRQFSPTCPTCHGTGRFYPSGSTYSTTLLLHQEDSRRTFEDAGTWMSGSIRASVLPGIRLCERDKVRLLDITDTANDEVLCRGLDETLRFTSVTAVEMIADSMRVYRRGVDYILTPPNTIVWQEGGMSPPFGAQYSVRYSYFPEFLVVGDSPRLRVENHRPQAQEVVLMRLDKLSEEL